MLRLSQERVVNKNGKQVKAIIARCDCTKETYDAALWVVFQLEKQSHMHLQCMNCCVSYCPAGTCGVDNVAAVPKHPLEI